MRTKTGAVRVNGTTLIHTTAGPAGGPVVVWLHDLFGWQEMMYPLMEHATAAGYRCYSYDHRGQGSSRPAARRELDLRMLTADAAGFVEQVCADAPTRPCVVGAGLGAMVALRLAAWYPHLIGSAVSLAGSAEAEHRRSQWEALGAHLTTHGMTGDLRTPNGPRPALDVVTDAMFGEWTRDNNPGLVRTWRARFATLDHHIGDAVAGLSSRDSVADDLRDCTVPVLALGGSEDCWYPPPRSSAAIAAAAGSGSSHAVVARAGHSIALEQPVAAGRHILRFLAGRA